MGAAPTAEPDAVLEERLRARAQLRPRDVAYRIYLVVLLGPAAAMVLEQVVIAIAALVALPLPIRISGVVDASMGVVAMAAGLLVAAGINTGAWRGPFRLERADVAWLLTSPLPRRTVVLPRLHRAALRSAGAGGGAGGVVGVVLAQLLDGGLIAAAAAGAVGGASLGLLTLAGSWWPLLAGGRAPRVLRTSAVAAAGFVVAGTLAVVRADLAPLVTRSGPWGWVVEAVAAASGGSGPAAVAWSAPVLLLAIGALRWLLRTASAPPLEELAQRSDHAVAVDAALFLGETSVAAEVRREALDALRGPSRLRLPPPRSAWGAIGWRDSTALLRAPGQTAAAASLSARGAAAVAAATSMVASAGGAADAAAAGRAFALLLVGAVLLQRGARQWAAPLRSALARPFGHIHLPWSHAALVRRHLVVPLAGLAVSGGIGAVVAGGAGAGPSGALAAVLPVPLLGLAAVLHSLRPPSPPGETAELMANEYGSLLILLRPWPQLVAFIAALLPSLALSGGAVASIPVAVGIGVVTTAVAWWRVARTAAPWDAA